MISITTQVESGVLHALQKREGPVVTWHEVSRFHTAELTYLLEEKKRKGQFNPFQHFFGTLLFLFILIHKQCSLAK